MKNRLNMDIIPHEIDNFLVKRKNFVKDIKGYYKRFVFVTYEDGKLKMGHSIEDKIGPLTEIDIDEFDQWYNYFDRI